MRDMHDVCRAIDKFLADREMTELDPSLIASGLNLPEWLIEDALSLMHERGQLKAFDQP